MPSKCLLFPQFPIKAKHLRKIHRLQKIIKNSQKSPHEIFIPSLTTIVEQNWFYSVPFEKYWPILFLHAGVLDHFVIVQINIRL
jgi:hypothetical protein